MALEVGLKLLRERYTLTNRRLETTSSSESWIGVSEDDSQVLIKVWPYSGADPPELLRALWDAELRTLYRVASAPGADESILVIRDAGLDRSAKCFVMVLEAERSSGYERLSAALANRNAHPWLRVSDLTARRDLWRALRRLAGGIALLHEQNTLHRNIEAEQVYFSTDTGVESFRLGGFEWSLRLGLPAAGSPPAGWSSPPEFFTEKHFGYRPETDWYGFGMLAARCFRPLEMYDKLDPIRRHRTVVQQIDKAATADLSDLEKTILLGIITEDPYERFSDSNTIRNVIDEIVFGLESNFQTAETKTPLILALNTNSIELVNSASESGFSANPEDPDEPFNPRDALHVGRLVRFVQEDIDQADPSVRISSVRNRNLFILEGEKLVLGLTQFQFTDRMTNHPERTWNVAYCPGVAELRGSESSIEFSSPKIQVQSVSEVRKRFPPKNPKNWQRYLPHVDLASKMKADLSRFYNYTRAARSRSSTNTRRAAATTTWRASPPTGSPSAGARA